MTAMNLPKSCSLLLIIGLFFSLSIPAKAHRIRIFAYEHGGQISAEASFSGGKPAKNAEVIIQNGHSHKTMLTGQTNDKGIFTFPIPEEARKEKTDLNIIIDLGEGHKNQWLLSASDYLPPPSSSPTKHQTHEINGSKARAPSPPLSRLEEEELQRIVEDALDKKLAPLKRMLAANLDPKPQLRDILGGIGYIIGLAGLLAYFRAQKITGKVKNNDG